jgi:zinc D-Ala-D-Ala carboxypeptidase
MAFPTASGRLRALAGLLLAVSLSFGPGCITDPAYRLARAHSRGHACGEAASPVYAAAARRNGRGLYVTAVNLFGRPEHGWAVYAPAIEHQVGALCRADSPGFAEAVARWSGDHGGEAGVLTPELLGRMKDGWQSRRPFVQLRARDVCPPPPTPTQLATVPADESYGKTVELQKGALDAWTRLVRAARRAEPALASNPQLFRIFSGFRSPAYDAARCARDNNCQGTVRAACSAHRTGLAMDVVLDTAPGQAVDSSADVNRLSMTRGLAYRWLVANARRYGFVNYVFEPWHWEWTGRTAII